MVDQELEFYITLPSEDYLLCGDEAMKTAIGWFKE